MKVKKLISMGLAAIMAVSAMSISVFAAEENHGGAVASFLAADGVSRIYLTQEDIDNGNNTVVGYDGIEFEVKTIETDSSTPLFYAATVNNIVFKINRTNPPLSTGSYVSVEKTEVMGSFDIAPSADKYSSCLFKNGSSTNVSLVIHPGMNLDNNVDFLLYSRGTTDRKLVSIAPESTTTLVTARNIKNYTLYVEAINGLYENAVGTVELLGSYS